jgi:hypothetical protein
MSLEKRAHVSNETPRRGWKRQRLSAVSRLPGKIDRLEGRGGMDARDEGPTWFAFSIFQFLVSNF